MLRRLDVFAVPLETLSQLARPSIVDAARLLLIPRRLDTDVLQIPSCNRQDKRAARAVHLHLGTTAVLPVIVILRTISGQIYRARLYYHRIARNLFQIKRKRVTSASVVLAFTSETVREVNGVGNDLRDAAGP
jgi:hypothetical protein